MGKGNDWFAGTVMRYELSPSTVHTGNYISLAIYLVISKSLSHTNRILSSVHECLLIFCVASPQNPGVRAAGDAFREPYIN